MNRQKLVLAVLFLVLAGALVYSYVRMPRQKTVDKLTFTTGMVATPRSKPTGASLENRLRLDMLDQVANRLSGIRRNIFKPIFSEEVKDIKLPPFPPPPPPPVKAVVAPPPPPVVTSAPVIVPTPVQMDMAKFTFLGFMKKDNKKTIFLSSNKEIFLVKKGDKVAGKYEVANITDEALTISIPAEGSEIIIPLVENRALNAPRQ